MWTLLLHRSSLLHQRGAFVYQRSDTKITVRVVPAICVTHTTVVSVRISFFDGRNNRPIVAVFDVVVGVISSSSYSLFVIPPYRMHVSRRLRPDMAWMQHSRINPSIFCVN